MCKETAQGKEKNHPKELEGIVLRIHTRAEIVLVFNSQSRKA